MKRNGRPKKAVTQEKYVGFFVTHQQFAVISKRVAAAGLNISDYMRQAAMTAEIRPRWTDDERSDFKAAVSICNDLHLVAEAYRREGIAAGEAEYVRRRRLFDDVIKRMEKNV